MLTNSSLGELYSRTGSPLESHHFTRPNSTKSTRFGTPRAFDQAITPARSQRMEARVAHQTPDRAHKAAQAPASTMTQQSFILPDLHNLTELVSGVRKDGTPVFTQSTRTRGRFTSARHLTNHRPIKDVPISSDEKAILASLEILQAKIAQLELEKAEHERRIEEQDNTIQDLQTELQARDKLRRPDSGLGSTDEEGGRAKANWRVDKIRLESSVTSLQSRLDRAERKISISEIEAKRITQERDNVNAQLVVALTSNEEFKVENEALQHENETLRNEVVSLREANQQLADLDDAHQEELDRMRYDHEEEVRRLTKKDIEGKKFDKAMKSEQTKLRAEVEAAKTELVKADTRRDDENRRWKNKENDMKARIDRQDETIRQLQEMTQDEANQTLRMENEKLRLRLSRVATEHDDETQRIRAEADDLKNQLGKSDGRRNDDMCHWKAREAELCHKIEQLNRSIRQMKEAAQDDHNQSLVNENETLKLRLERFTAAQDGETQQFRVREAGLQQKLANAVADHQAEASAWARQEAILRTKISQSEEAVDEARENAKLRAQLKLQHRRVSVGKVPRNLMSTTHDASGERERARPTTSRDAQKRTSAAATEAPSRRVRMDVLAEKSGNERRRSKSKPRHVSVQDIESDAESTTDLNLSAYAMERSEAIRPRDPRLLVAAAADITLLSAMDTADIARIRLGLEEERAAARKRSAALRSDENATVGTGKAAQPAPLPRKSSLKELTQQSLQSRRDDATRRSSLPNFARADAAGGLDESNDGVDNPPQQQQRERDGTTTRGGIATGEQATGHSVRSNASRRRQHARSSTALDPTSAFLIPDFALHRAPASTSTAPATAAHDAQACTLCTPGAPIPAAIPASVQQQQLAGAAAAADEDATQRPTEPPPAALAGILKTVADEIAHLKLALAAAEAAYAAHEPALGRRRRRALYARVRALLASVDARCELAYRLYDVLEGVGGGAAAPGPSDEAAAAVDAVDVTLERLGIDVDALRRVRYSVAGKTAPGTANLAAAGAADAGAHNESADDVDYDDDDGDDEDGLDDGEDDAAVEAALLLGANLDGFDVPWTAGAHRSSHYGSRVR